MKDHDWMFVVLCRLAELEAATSREVADGLGVSGRAKYISLVLTRCFRRGLVSRTPYKSGRLHGYVYKLTNKGAEWLLFKVSPRKRKNQLSKKSMKEEVKEEVKYRPIVLHMEPPRKSRDSKAIENMAYTLAMLEVGKHVQRDQSFHQWFTLFSLVRQSREEDAATCWFLMRRLEEEKNSRLLEKYFKEWSKTQSMINETLRGILYAKI